MTDVDMVAEHFRASEAERADVDRNTPWASVGPMRFVRVEQQLAGPTAGAPSPRAKTLASGSRICIITEVPFEDPSMRHLLESMKDYWGAARCPAVVSTSYKLENGRLRSDRRTLFTMSTKNRVACTCKNLNQWFCSNFTPGKGSTDEPDTT